MEKTTRLIDDLSFIKEKKGSCKKMMRKQFVELRMKKTRKNIKKNVLQDEKHEI